MRRLPSAAPHHGGRVGLPAAVEQLLVPTQGRVDIFAPDVVVWAYDGPPQRALRALLDLVHPAHPDAPTIDYPAPGSLHIPRAQQRPMTIRPPSPGKASVRAARLAAAMPDLRPEEQRRCGDYV